MNKKNQQVVDLTTSRVSRQNVLNNRYALENIRSAVGIKCVLFDGEYRILKQDVASFFEISQRGLEKVVARNGEELQGNGYAVFEGNALKAFMLACEESYAGELKFGTKTTALATFSFRAFLNVAMLLTRSEKAKVLRSAILDIVIDTINERVGGSTKFINQRDEDFVLSLLTNADYHKDFIDALSRYVDMGKVKYAIYTNKIYHSIFKEDADEYRRVLRLKPSDDERSTMYSEVLDIVASYEAGFAEALAKESERLGRRLSSNETDKVFALFEGMRLWQPLKEKARVKMASRDMCFRDVVHDKLSEYIQSVPAGDFDRFIGDKSMPLEERLVKYLMSTDDNKSDGE